MIRRNPTLITMTDSDVQDVRDMIALKRAEAATAAAVTNGKGKGKDMPQPQTPATLVHSCFALIRAVVVSRFFVNLHSVHQQTT
ncbi:hypothetical protein HETIRDRAFT_452165 [Heterobasidion irregulare TC 32-1]|uniref:Uncharacterized protein n=1 Tax=Heterobasidion irregulare (strain TC 32-1) TaxID=747525 RepID=W4K433_HETIT|nr:uncharacterized protein HETIRDRAFT_452165 [Heterobasidion irregulare TC 32-1]ETW80603.1 hypothetical protein HETIRDRAFT_452165 [Heterobasidion irregulare TC 32-1]